MFTIKQNKWFVTFPAELTVGDSDIVINGKTPIFLRWTKPYQHVLPYQQISSINLDKGVAASTINIQMSGGAVYNVASLPHDDAAKAVALIREKMSQANPLVYGKL